MESLPQSEVNCSSIERLKTLRKTGGFFPVSDKAAIRLTGSDRTRYLNGQLTIDISKLREGVGRHALLLTAKGKLCAPLWIWKEADSFVLEVETSLLEETIARLERYIVSDDVVLSSESAAQPFFHVFGAGTSGGCRQINRLGVPGFDTSEMPKDSLLAERSDVEYLRIVRGIPRWGAELDSDTLPQEAGLETSSVEFDKGCYVGQEVVSRLASVGRVNRRLHFFVGTLEPASEDRLFLRLPHSSNGPVGILTSRCCDFELAQTVALGYLNRQFEDAPSFEAVDAAGKVLGKFEKRPILT